MYGVVQYFANGMSFFPGAFLILMAALSGFSKKKWLKRSASFLCCLGMILVFISATPFSYLFYGISISSILLWFLAKDNKNIKPIRKVQSRILLILVSVFAIVVELPYHFHPQAVMSSHGHFVVFGDSITAGMGGDKIKTWPKILEQEHGMKVQDLSRVGATVSTALRKAKENQLEGDVAIVEIGGNDLFGSTTMQDFEADLDSLLKLLREQNKVIYLFELPLIPCYNEYGRIQRRLAKKYYVRLIPKRVLMSVLAGDEATIDSIHLTQRGQHAMAKQVLEIVYDD